MKALLVVASVLAVALLAVTAASGSELVVWAAPETQTWSALYAQASDLGQQGNWPEALRTAKVALKKAEQTFGADSLNASKSHVLLGNLYASRGKFVWGEIHFTKGIKIREQVLGSSHPGMVRPLTSLAELYDAKGKKELAEVVYHQAIEIADTTEGADDVCVARALVGLSGLFKEKGTYAQCEPLLTRAQALCEQSGKYGKPLDALNVRILNFLADNYTRQGNYAKAGDCFRKTVAILENGNETDRLLVCTIHKRLGDLYVKAGTPTLASDSYKKAAALHAKSAWIAGTSLD
jgi:tetratricopeptide (TPR) repeat protein